MDPGELWSIGDYAIVGDLWSQPGSDLAPSLDTAGRDIAGRGVADLDVVDLATGTGVTAIAIARRGARSVIGVDAAPKLLAEAARRATANGVDVDWIEADVASAPGPTGRSTSWSRPRRDGIRVAFQLIHSSGWRGYPRRSGVECPICSAR